MINQAVMRAHMSMEIRKQKYTHSAWVPVYHILSWEICDPACIGQRSRKTPASPYQQRAVSDVSPSLPKARMYVCFYVYMYTCICVYMHVCKERAPVCMFCI